MKILNLICLMAMLWLQHSCHQPQSYSAKEDSSEIPDSANRRLKISYNKQRIIIGVNESRVDTLFIRNSLFQGEKFFSSSDRDTLIALNIDQNMTYLYILNLKGQEVANLLNDYIGFVSEQKYHGTKKAGNRFIKDTFDLRYNQDSSWLVIDDQRTYVEVSVTEYEKILASYLQDFVFPNKTFITMMDVIPHRYGFVNMNIPLAEVDTSHREIVRTSKGMYAYPDYVFNGQIDQTGHANDIVGLDFNIRNSRDSVIVNEVILDFLKRKRFEIGKFNNLPANYMLDIRVTFTDE